MNQEVRDEIVEMVKDGVGTALIWAVRAFWLIGVAAAIYLIYGAVTGNC